MTEKEKSETLTSGPDSSAQRQYPARQRRREATAERILQASAALFYQKGIQAVSMEEAAAAANVTKPTLYAHYDSKGALVAAALAAVDQLHFDWFQRQWRQHAEAGQVPVLAVFDVLEAWFHSSVFRGCAYINASLELGASNPPAQIAVLRHKERTRHWLQELAVQSGVAEHRSKDLADHLMLLMEGAIVTAAVEYDEDAAARARTAAAVLLDAALTGTPAPRTTTGSPLTRTRGNRRIPPHALAELPP